MGIIGNIKQISESTLDLLREEPLLVDAFLNAQYLPDAFWQPGTYRTGEWTDNIKQKVRERFDKLSSHGQSKNLYNWQALEEQFLAEWEIPELDLHKYWQELTFLLAGYVPGYVTSKWTVPELKMKYLTYKGIVPELKINNRYTKDYLPFLVIENSAWDKLPLVNAFGAGTEIGYETDYGPLRYLTPREVGIILDGLLQLSEEGYQKRFIRESQKSEPLPWIDWSEEEMLDWMTDYYNATVDYYHTAFRQHKALLLYLT